MNNLPLYWLPIETQWEERIRQLERSKIPSWHELRALANTRMNCLQTERLHSLLQHTFHDNTSLNGVQSERLAVLSSCTVAQLYGAIRVAALRRGMWIDIFQQPFGDYYNELVDKDSALRLFKPSLIIFSFDESHLVQALNLSADHAEAQRVTEKILSHLRACWKLARQISCATVIQQTFVPATLPLMGGNEHLFPGSRRALGDRLNYMLRKAAEEEGVLLLAIDLEAAKLGLSFWHNPSLWHHAKQDISPAAAPLYGELLVRLLSAIRGMSAKCLVLDLDQTIWGGIIGDDGTQGIILGQGSAAGEAYLDFQRYALGLSRRGVLLAVCSHNEEAAAVHPFLHHPEMLLRRPDISCFAAGWESKPIKLRRIANELNIALNSLVLADDSLFERNLVRHELPEVIVPEMPQDPALYGQCLSDAGYFEAVVITEEDRARTEYYQAEQERMKATSNAGSIEDYLTELKMKLWWSPFCSVDLPRIAQLVNKTNQFNLTTRRYNEREISKLMEDPLTFALSFRLEDRFGDNGIIALIIAKENEPKELFLDTWLLSCRVFGRGVERAMFNLLAQKAKLRGLRRMVGLYIPTERNEIVKDFYQTLGFSKAEIEQGGKYRSSFELEHFRPQITQIEIVQR